MNAHIPKLATALVGLLLVGGAMVTVAQEDNATANTTPLGEEFLLDTEPLEAEAEEAEEMEPSLEPVYGLRIHYAHVAGTTSSFVYRADKMGVEDLACYGLPLLKRAEIEDEDGSYARYDGSSFGMDGDSTWLDVYDDGLCSLVVATDRLAEVELQFGKGTRFTFEDHVVLFTTREGLEGHLRVEGAKASGDLRGHTVELVLAPGATMTMALGPVPEPIVEEPPVEEPPAEEPPAEEPPANETEPPAGNETEQPPSNETTPSSEAIVGIHLDESGALVHVENGSGNSVSVWVDKNVFGGEMPKSLKIFLTGDWGKFFG